MRLPFLLLAGLAALAACNKPAAEGNGAATASAQPAEGPAPAGKVDRSHAGKPAPGVKFDDPKGETVSLASFEGKPLLLNLWATWCGPCVQEMPSLDKLAAARGDTLQVVAVSQDMGGKEKVDAFLQKAKLSTIKPYLDQKLAAMGALGVEVLPTTILFDANGREVWRITGREDWQGEAAGKLFAEASR